MDLRRNLLRPVKDALDRTRRQLRRLATSPRTAAIYAQYRARARRHDWRGLHEKLQPWRNEALRANDMRLLRDLGEAAWRLDEYQLGIEMLYAAHRQTGAKPSDWRGEDISDATLVISLMEKASQAVVTGIHLAGYIRAAARRATHGILVVEPRMVPLFTRTLPELTVLPFGAALEPHVRGRVVTASILDLQYILGFDAATITRLITPIVASAGVTTSLRKKYLLGRDVPLIGLSWWSSHTGKELPALVHWRRLIEAMPAQFVSLQYGDVADDVRRLCGGNPSRLIVDSSIDQMTDMDRFASQLAALDLVVTISNSGAHLAGAMGRPVILVRDDLFRRSWPYLSRSVPWYPRTSIIGRDGRPWEQAFAEVIETAQTATKSS